MALNKPTSWSLKWKDALNAIIITLIGQALLIIMQAADATFPSLEDFKVGLIGSIKYAVIPYLLKNFFQDDIKSAQNTLDKAKKKCDDIPEQPYTAPKDSELNQ